jgi:hypothetical protein
MVGLLVAGYAHLKPVRLYRRVGGPEGVAYHGSRRPVMASTRKMRRSRRDSMSDLD